MLKKIGYYLNPLTLFRKPDPNRKPSGYLKAMHGINRLSILMFLACLIVLLIRFLSS